MACTATSLHFPRWSKILRVSSLQFFSFSRPRFSCYLCSFSLINLINMSGECLCSEVIKMAKANQLRQKFGSNLKYFAWGESMGGGSCIKLGLDHPGMARLPFLCNSTMTENSIFSFPLASPSHSPILLAFSIFLCFCSMLLEKIC